MKTYQFSLIVLASLLLPLPGSPSLQAQEGDVIQWSKIRPTRPSSAPPVITDSTPSFYKRKAEWRRIIDEYWGPGVPASEKRRIFDAYADYIQRYCTVFEGLDISWDSLRAHYSSQINDSTSHGRFSAILSHLAYQLREVHVRVIDFSMMSVAVGDTVVRAWPTWGKPVWCKTGFPTASHFGAVLTPQADSSAVVLRAIENHPLGLKRGDVVLGYEGVPWRQIARELLAAEVPSIYLFGGSRSMETHYLLGSAGYNWHLFDTIDIVKFPGGDTLHVPVDTLASIRMVDSMYNNECLEVPGVPRPDWDPWGRDPAATWVSHGVVQGSNVGYIYVSGHTSRFRGDYSPDSEELFTRAVGELWTTDGLIIDLRDDRGGWVESNLKGGFARLLNFDTQTLSYWRRASGSDLRALQPWPVNFDFDINGMFIDADEETVYDRPIAVLVGPGCWSMGDATAYRLSYFPNTRFFGKPTSMGLAGLNWTGQAPKIEGYMLDASDVILKDYYDPKRNLERMEFPVDEPVWFTREDVANGDDTVVKRALAWIRSVPHAHHVVASGSSLAPGLETLRLKARVANPEGHALSVKAYFRRDSTVVDSVLFADDGLHGDGAQGDGLWGALWKPPAEEHFYSAAVRVSDPAGPSTFPMPYAARFTTAGPLTCAGYSITSTDTVPNPGNRLAFRIKLKNNGSAVTIPAVTARVTALDSGNIAAVTVQQYGDISPGAEVLPTTGLIIQFSSTHPGMYVAQFAVDVSSMGMQYWRDTVRVVVTGIEGEEIALPTQFSLSQNYPNPFNPKTVVSFQLPVASNVRLVVYDLLGREVATLVNESKPAGAYSVQFDARGLASGVYLYRMTAGSFVETRKLMLLR